MKKVIDGKVYNTETATFLAEYFNGASDSDFNLINEELYITKKGSFFMYVHGGANTKYGIDIEGGKYRGSNQTLVALTPEKVYSWLEEQNEIELIEKYFADKLEEA